MSPWPHCGILPCFAALPTLIFCTRMELLKLWVGNWFQIGHAVASRNIWQRKIFVDERSIQSWGLIAYNFSDWESLALLTNIKLQLIDPEEIYNTFSFKITTQYNCHTTQLLDYAVSVSQFIWKFVSIMASFDPTAVQLFSSWKEVYASSQASVTPCQ